MPPTPTPLNFSGTNPPAPTGEFLGLWQVSDSYPVDVLVNGQVVTVLFRDASVYSPGSPVQQEKYTYGPDTGAANAYAVALSPVPTLVAGSVVVFKSLNANTGASTLAVNGGSAKAIKKNVSSALASGDILAGQIVVVVYDGTNFQMAGGGGVTLPIAESDVTGLVSDLALKAPLASPAFTGAPTAPTPSLGDDSTLIATTAFVEDVVDTLVTGVSSVFGRTGVVVAANADYVDEQTKNADATLALTKQTTYVEATAGVSGIMLTLPPVATSDKYVVIVKKADSAVGTVTVKGNASENIDGVNTYVITSQYAFVALECDGNNWLIVGSSRALSGGAIKGTFGVTVDGGGGAVPTTGLKGYIRVPYAGIITGWDLFGDAVGSCQFTIKKSTYTGFPPTASIVASDPPVMTSAQKATSAHLTGWTLVVAAGDVFSFNLDSVSILSRITIEVQVDKTT